MEEQQFDYEAQKRKYKIAKTILIISAVVVGVFVTVGIPLISIVTSQASYKEKQLIRKYGQSISYEEFQEKFDYKFDNFLGVFDSEGHAKSFKIVDETKTKNDVNMRRDSKGFALRYKTEKEKNTYKVTTTYDFTNEIKERKVNDTSYTAFIGKGQNEVSRKNNKSYSHLESYNINDQKKVIEINKIEGTYLTKATIAEDKTYNDTLYLESQLHFKNKFHYSGYIDSETAKSNSYYFKNDSFTIIAKNISYDTTSADGFKLHYRGESIYTFNLKEGKPSVEAVSLLECSSQYNAKGTGGDNAYFFFDSKVSESKKITFKKLTGSLNKEDFTKYTSKD